MSRPTIVLSLFGAIVWVGCGRSASVTGSDKSKITVSQEGEDANVSITASGGRTAAMSLGGEAPLPEAFPRDMVYPGAKLTMAVKDKQSVTATFSSNDLPSGVLSFYQEKLKAGGWEMVYSTQESEGGGIQAKHKDRGRCVLSISHPKKEEKTVIGATFTIVEAK
jgi:hypothetical protein